MGTKQVKPWAVAVYAGMASYLDAGALVASGLVFGVFYAQELGLTDVTIGLLAGAQTLSLAVGAVCGGRLGDRFGRRRVFTATMLLFILGTVLVALAPNLTVLLIGAIVTGFAVGADLPVSLAMISESAPPGKKGKMVAFTELLWGLGIVVSSVFGAVLTGLGAWGGRIIFLQLAVIALAVLLLRRTVAESSEWSAAATSGSRGAAGGRMSVREMLRPPVLWVLVATGAYYAAWGIGANTIGQFGAYLWVQRADQELPTWSLVSLVGIPLAALAGLWFLRVVDTPRRQLWFIVGSVMLIAGWLAPVIWDITPLALVAAALLLQISTGFSGETIYKVWSQELLPTLGRATGQGITFAFNRVIAAGFAFVTPVLATNAPVVLFGIVAAFAVVGLVIGVFWIPRLQLTARTATTDPAVTAQTG